MYLSANSHPWAIKQLRLNQDKIHWPMLNRNTRSWTIEQLMRNQDKIDWWVLSANLGFFEWSTDPAVVAQLTEQ